MKEVGYEIGLAEMMYIVIIKKRGKQLTVSLS